MTALNTAQQNRHTSRLHWGTRTIFLINGLAMSAWAPLVPFARDRLQLTGASLGALLLCLGIGSLAAMPVTGKLVARFGCRRVMLVSTLLVLIMLPLLATAASHLLLAAALMLFGAGLGTLDVAMNYQAVEVEKAAGRPMMSGFHGFFSLGGILGAGTVSLLLSAAFTPLTAVLVVMAVMLLLLIWRLPGFMNDRLHQPEQPWLVILGGVSRCAVLYPVSGRRRGAGLGRATAATKPDDAARSCGSRLCVVFGGDDAGTLHWRQRHSSLWSLSGHADWRLSRSGGHVAGCVAALA